MAIEFKCTGCGKTLRVPDDAAGRKASCPACSAIIDVPLGAVPPGESMPPLSEFSGPESSPFGDLAEGQDSAAINPYAAPQTTASSVDYSDESGRNGPPWERDGKSLNTFWETVKLTIAAPAAMFSTMRREGGLGAPVLFAICGGLVGAFAGSLWGGLLQIGMLNAGGRLGGAGVGLSIAGMLIQSILQGTIGVIIGLFVGAGVLHLMLMIVGGAQQSFEATCRVVAYVYGSIGLLNVVPCVGWVAAIVCYFISTIIGVSETHGISRGKAAVAVFLPTLVCLGAAAVLFGVGVAIWAARAAPQFGR